MAVRVTRCTRATRWGRSLAYVVIGCTWSHTPIRASPLPPPRSAQALAEHHLVRTTAAREPRGAARRPLRVSDPAPSSSRHAQFEALFADHERPVLAYAMRRTRSAADAEDAAAETFAIAWRKLETVPTDALPWLYAAARRVLANQRRGSGRRERLASLLRVEDVPTPMRLGEDLDGPASRALAMLKPAEQEILRLMVWEELGNQQIAKVLGITPNAVAIRLHRARARFADALGKTSGVVDLKGSDPSRTSTDVTGTNSAAWKGVGK